MGQRKQSDLLRYIAQLVSETPAPTTMGALMGHRDESGRDLAGLRAIVDAGGPQTPVVSGARPPSMSAGPRKPTLQPDGGEILGRAKTILDLLNATPLGLLGDVSAPLENMDAAGPVAGVKKGIRAFHASPHDFDRFSLDKIGTGEGAQSFGHGLYFAESPAVSGPGGEYWKKFTRQMQQSHNLTDATKSIKVGDAPLADDIDFMPEFVEAAKSGDTEQFATLANDRLRQWRELAADASYPHRDYAVKKIGAYESVLGKIAKGEKVGYPQARAYEVDINADPDDFLDWDAPLSQQSEKVRQKLGDLGTPRVVDHPQFPGHFGVDYGDGNVSGLYASPQAAEKSLEWATPLSSPDPRAEWVHERLKSAGGNVAASDALKARGIPGIKYLDGASRSAGQGSRNYVVFDDKLISIVKKYGVAGALTAGLINQAQAQQLQQEGYE